MSHLFENIIKKIKDGQIKPTPKWVFFLKKSVIWSLFAISVLFGSLAVSIIIFQISDADWAVYSKMSNNWIEFIVGALPYFWIILMALFLVLAHYNFRHTEKGYRYNVFAIFGLSVVLSVLLGGTFYFSSLSEKVESALLSNIPHYGNLNYGKQILWFRPEKGFLAGTVLQMNDNYFILHDFRDHDWQVDMMRSDFIPGFVLKEKVMVKMIGNYLETGKFNAKLISPYYKIQIYR